jgi:hypothetical protein
MHYFSSALVRNPSAATAWSTGAVAGLAGGAAEIVWIMLFEHLTGGEAAVVARGVTGSIFRQLESASLAIPLGIMIHMGLAILLGITIAILLRSWMPRLGGTALEPVVIIVMLIAIWATNFFLILPAVNPAFVAVIPYAASLVSKVLFGAAAALVFQICGTSRQAIERINKETWRNAACRRLPGFLSFPSCSALDRRGLESLIRLEHAR